MSGGFQVKIIKQFTPEFLQAARELYLENRWIDENTSPDFPEKAFAGSFAVAGAFSSHGEIAGMGRAVSDGVSDAYIQDIMTARKFQRRGVGKLIVRTLVAELKAHNIDWIGLVGVPGTEKFYETCGLKCAPGHTLWLAEKEN